MAGVFGATASGFAKEDPTDLVEAEKMLRAFAALEKGSGERR
jgi:hypothetical protein